MYLCSNTQIYLTCRPCSILSLIHKPPTFQTHVDFKTKSLVKMVNAWMATLNSAPVHNSSFSLSLSIPSIFLSNVNHINNYNLVHSNLIIFYDNNLSLHEFHICYIKVSNSREMSGSQKNSDTFFKLPRNNQCKKIIWVTTSFLHKQKNYTSTWYFMFWLWCITSWTRAWECDFFWLMISYQTWYKKGIFERHLRLYFIVLVSQKLTCELIRTIILEDKKQVEGS